MILIIIMYALFAASFSMGKLLLNHTSPIFLTGIRMLIAGPILLAYQFFSHHGIHIIGLRGRGLSIFFSQGLFYRDK